MKLVAYVHAYPGFFNAGAELTLHSILRWLTENGHECKVLSSHTPPGTHQGIEVQSSHPQHVRDIFSWADIAFTHLDRTGAAMREAKRHHVPLIHLVHNHEQLHANDVSLDAAQLVVFNSMWIANQVVWSGPRMILHPPVFLKDYRTDTDRTHVTLINLSEAKGGQVFWELAQRHPSRKFLGVKGSYARQVIPNEIPLNVELVENTPDLREVYSRTRVLLMPSSYESFGRVAIEAAASSIPTIASPMPGLKESLGTAAIFAHHNITGKWDLALSRLDHPGVYEAVGRLALARAEELEKEAYEQLESLERRMTELVRRREASRQAI